MEIYPHFFLIHLFYHKNLETLNHQSVFLVCFSKASPNEEYANLYMKNMQICLFYYFSLIRRQYSSSVRYTSLSIFSDDNADIFGSASLLFRMDFFGAAHEWGGGPFWIPSLKSASHILQWWNLAPLYLT